LFTKDLLNGESPLLFTVHLKPVLTPKGRFEKRKPLNVVPVIVGQEYTPFPIRPVFIFKVSPQLPEASPRIENNNAVILLKTYTSRVPTNFGSVRPGHWD
jgi:hypothetical protein